jgi:hypothetical protein
MRRCSCDISRGWFCEKHKEWPIKLAIGLVGLVASIIGIFTFYPSSPKRIEIKLKDHVFRSAPSTALSEDSVAGTIKKYNFYCTGHRRTKWSNAEGKEFHSRLILQDRGEIVMDIESGLTWQREGSYLGDTSTGDPRGGHNYQQAIEYINSLNKTSFGGYSDWRMPTLEEAMSLVRQQRINGILFIDPLFSREQLGTWTSDEFNSNEAWFVFFNAAGCDHLEKKFSGFVRAVR